MRFVMPITPAGTASAIETLRLYVPHAEFIDVSADEEAYWRLFRQLWIEEKSFALIEHDIEIHEGVVPTFLDCKHDWCVFPYNGPNWQAPNGNLFTGSLGCTRFSDRLMKREPDFPDSLGTTTRGLARRDWRRLDNLVTSGLLARGYGVDRIVGDKRFYADMMRGPVIHDPPVLHHHVYDGVCACEAVHV